MSKEAKKDMCVVRLNRDLIQKVDEFCEKRFISRHQFIELAMGKYLKKCEESNAFFRIPPKLFQNQEKLKQEIKSLKETCEIMSNPKTMKGIAKSLKQIAEGKGIPLEKLNLNKEEK